MKIFEKGELKILWPFYLEASLAYIIQFAPAFMLIFLINSGLSLTQAGILLAVMPLSSFILEIPTGAIADLYGRKFSVLMGYSLEGLGALLIFFFRSYTSLLLIFILWGCASTLSSGSKEAWIVDLIKSKNKKYLTNYFSKEKFFCSTALIISGVLGAFFVKGFGISIVWLFSAGSYLISIVILLFAKEVQVSNKKVGIKQSFRELKDQSKKSVGYAIKHPVLFYLILAGFFMIISMVFAETLGYVPFLKSLGFPDYAFGYFWSATWGIMAIAPLLSKKLIGKHKEVNFLIITTLLGSLVLLLIYFTSNYVSALAVIFVALFFYGLKYPIEKPYFHKFVPSKLRATIGSFEAMIFSLAAVLAAGLGGYLIDLIGARMVIIISALLGIPSVILYLMIKEEKWKN